MDKIRWGIVSAGRIAHTFAQDIRHVDQAELCAVAARSLDSAQAFANDYSIPKAHGSYQLLFDDPDIDAIYVATPHTFHLEHSSDALKSGKAVLCEKPLTINPEECKELIELSRSTGSYLMEAMWTYFLPAVEKANEWVTENRIGTIKHIKVDFGYPLLPFDANRREYDKGLAGGCLLEMGIYPVAFAWLIMQEDPNEIQVTSRMAPNGVEDDVVAILNYSNAVATIATSFRCKLQNWAYIIGERGYIAIPDFWRASECYLYELDTQTDHFTDQRTTNGFSYEIASVSDDLLQDRKASEKMPLQFSLKFQQHMSAIRDYF